VSIMKTVYVRSLPWQLFILILIQVVSDYD